MNYDFEINNLKRELSDLRNSFIQFANNNNKTVDMADDTANKVVALTPYIETKTAYIGDTEISFDNVPSGNLSVFADNINEYRTDRVGSTLNIDFIKPLEEVTEVTISIQ